MEQSKYGELTTLSMGTKTWVLLNSERVAKEIIAKRAALTHERPHFPIASTLVSRGKRQFLMKTEDWREGRRLLHGLLLGAGAKDQGAIAEDASIGLLQNYLDESDAWYAHHFHYAVTVLNKVVFNQPTNNPRKDLEDLQGVTSTFLTSINSSFVEFFPQLEYVPKFLQFWRAHWENMGTFHYNTFTKWWISMKDGREPDAAPSFARDKACNEFSGDEETSMYLSILAVVAGSDNPRMAINAFVMACIAHPETLQQARDEINKICGKDATRLPGLDDMASLPLVCATVKEVLRWRPIVPIMPQRVLVEDMEFEGYTFPAGTEFLANTMAISRNMCDDPETFRPQRWLEIKGGIDQDLWQYAFSAGRRSCVGYKLAQKMLFVAYARLLYCFDFESAGKVNDRQLNFFSPGEPFPVKIRVRSAAHEKLIRELAEPKQ